MSLDLLKGDRFFLVCSDVHGSAGAWGRFESFVPGASFVVHCGDLFYHGPRNPLPDLYDPKGLSEALGRVQVPLFLIRGNCDASVDQLMAPVPLVDRLAVFWEGISVIGAHGEDFTAFREEAIKGGFRLALSGHTHVASVVREGDTVFLNPGSLSLPKGKDPASFAVVSTGGLGIVTLDGEVLHREAW